MQKMKEIIFIIPYILNFLPGGLDGGQAQQKDSKSQLD